jgi:hypothetical protein
VRRRKVCVECGCIFVARPPKDENLMGGYRHDSKLWQRAFNKVRLKYCGNHLYKAERLEFKKLWLLSSNDRIEDAYSLLTEGK